ncbi:MAG: transcription elongation factor GreA, partial [Bacteroidota bacterium]
YDAAKEAQGLLEARIAKLESTVANARVIDESEVDTSRVRILSKVTVRNRKVNREVTYTLVSAEEADLKAQKISVDSPIGKALLGKEKGETVRVKIPAGVVELDVLDITR